MLELTSVESIGDYAFYFAGLKGSLELPEGLKTIGENAFEACANMGANLYLPSTLEAIGSNAFKGDYNIQYIVLESPTAPALGENVFAGCDYLYGHRPERRTAPVRRCSSGRPMWTRWG